MIFTCEAQSIGLIWLYATIFALFGYYDWTFNRVESFAGCPPYNTITTKLSQAQRVQRAFLHNRIPYDSTGVCSYQLTKLSGDVHPNPGPPRNRVKYPCGECLRCVRNNQDAILCAKCAIDWLLTADFHLFEFHPGGKFRVTSDVFAQDGNNKKQLLRC